MFDLENECGQYAMLALGKLVGETLLMSNAYTTQNKLDIACATFIAKRTYFNGGNFECLSELFWMGTERAFSNHNNQEV